MLQSLVSCVFWLSKLNKYQNCVCV